MNIYEEIYQENMDMLMHSLAERTQLGKQKWEELRYYPVSFIQDDDSEEREAYISHMFEMETEFNGGDNHKKSNENLYRSGNGSGTYVHCSRIGSCRGK